jgi:hypothetical protein
MDVLQWIRLEWSLDNMTKWNYMSTGGRLFQLGNPIKINLAKDDGLVQNDIVIISLILPKMTD